MVRTIKTQIIDAARALFIEHGYDAVSMRQIAAACNISVGNLTYHYPKKEDILMTIHDDIMEQYQSQLSDDWKQQMGLAGYFASEYAFHYFITHSDAFYMIYRQVINSPIMRQTYYNRHLSLYQTFINNDEDSELLWDATIVTSSLEFHFMESGALRSRFDDSFRKIFKSRLLFMEKDPDQYSAVIEKGIEEGKILSRRIQIHY